MFSRWESWGSHKVLDSSTYQFRVKPEPLHSHLCKQTARRNNGLSWIKSPSDLPPFHSFPWTHYGIVLIPLWVQVLAIIRLVSLGAWSDRHSRYGYLMWVMFLTTCDANRQSVFCFSSFSSLQLWRVHHNPIRKKGKHENTSTGQRISYVHCNLVSCCVYRSKLIEPPDITSVQPLWHYGLISGFNPQSLRLRSSWCRSLFFSLSVPVQQIFFERFCNTLKIIVKISVAIISAWLF